jgi:xanthine dehydrogenase accessory factor
MHWPMPAVKRCHRCRRAKHPIRLARPLARYLNPVCGMGIDIASAKHVLDYGGERFYFCCDGCKQEFDRQPAKYLAIVQAKAHLEKT